MEPEPREEPTQRLHYTVTGFFTASPTHHSIIDVDANTHVAPEGGFELEPYPSVRAWLDRVAAEPGHVPIEV